MFTACSCYQLGTLRSAVNTEAQDPKVTQNIISKLTLILKIFNRRKHASRGNHKIYVQFMPQDV